MNYTIQRREKLILRVLSPRRFAQILTLLTCISEVLGSNTGDDINYSKDFSVFLSRPRQSSGIVHASYDDRFLPYPFHSLCTDRVRHEIVK